MCACERCKGIRREALCARARPIGADKWRAHAHSRRVRAFCMLLCSLHPHDNNYNEQHQDTTQIDTRANTSRKHARLSRHTYPSQRSRRIKIAGSRQAQLCKQQQQQQRMRHTTKTLANKEKIPAAKMSPFDSQQVCAEADARAVSRNAKQWFYHHRFLKTSSSHHILTMIIIVIISAIIAQCSAARSPGKQ